MSIFISHLYSYLPEAGQYACIMLYLQNSIDFSKAQLAGFIALLGILGIIAQTFALFFRIVFKSNWLRFVLSNLAKYFSQRRVVIIALVCSLIQVFYFIFLPLVELIPQSLCCLGCYRLKWRSLSSPSWLRLDQ